MIKRKPQYPPSNRGYSLIEVLITMALVSMIVVGASEMLIQAVRIQRKADANLDMTGIASTRLEEIRGKSRGMFGGASNPGEAFTASGRRNTTYIGTWRTESTDGILDRLVFEIRPELKPEAMISLRILICRELSF
jgi:prepilin-type N-terminal cleavage/methylation domain-containing protein